MIAITRCFSALQRSRSAFWRADSRPGAQVRVAAAAKEAAKEPAPAPPPAKREAAPPAPREPRLDFHVQGGGKVRRSRAAHAAVGRASRPQRAHGARVPPSAVGAEKRAPPAPAPHLRPCQVRTRVSKDGEDLLVSVEVEGVPAAQRTPLVLSWCVRRDAPSARRL